MSPIALLSVSDKTGLIPLAKALINDLGFKIISSGGTAKLIESENLPVTRVADYTGFPEILGGRVKTLNPKIHGGILARRDKQSHLDDLDKQNINPIDLVVVNLYPFVKTISKENVSWEEAIENIDIGGPTMIRAAAKNHQDVLVVTDPSQYSNLIDAYKSKKITTELRKKYSQQAFEHTATYDLTISNWIANQSSSKKVSWLQSLPLKQELRYGENPHQKASWYGEPEKGWSGANQLQGKELSTNNLLDLEAALSTLREFGYKNTISNPSYQKAAVVIKHTNPCGVAIGKTIDSALTRALDSDRVSCFGGIIALNREVNIECANEIIGAFYECIVAPSFSNEAKEILASKKNLRLLELDIDNIQLKPYNVRSILGGVLVQEKDNDPVNIDDWKVVSERQPSVQERIDLTFAWKVCRHVRSNAILVASDGATLGVGAGQMNRVGSAKIALTSYTQVSGAALASDGFFPFGDTVRLAYDYGIKALIQPGGSIKDQESIDACNELGMTMIFTNKRHFLH